MKCSVCGKEFGDGLNCQHCGIDRVAGLGNYNGYSPSIMEEKRQRSLGESSYKPYSNAPSTAGENHTICWSCGEIIPMDARYCPYCNTQLLVECPKCKHSYSSKYPSCPKCGTNRAQYAEYLKEQEILRRKQEEEERKRRQQEARRESERRHREQVRKETKTMIWLVGTIIGGMFVFPWPIAIYMRNHDCGSVVAGFILSFIISAIVSAIIAAVWDALWDK